MKKMISLTLVLASCMVAKADFIFGEAMNLGPMVNSLYDDVMPSISADTSSLSCPVIVDP